MAGGGGEALVLLHDLVLVVDGVAEGNDVLLALGQHLGREGGREGGKEG
jgi:hypothetical protein